MTKTIIDLKHPWRNYGLYIGPKAQHRLPVRASAQTGMGKTTLCEAFLCQEVDAGHKGLDAGDKQRLEPAHYVLEEDRARFLRGLKALGISPKRYDVQILYLHYEGRVGRRFEQVPDFFTPYKLPWNLLTTDDLVRLVKHSGESGTWLAEMVCDRALRQLAEERPDAEFYELPRLMAKLGKDKAIDTLGFKAVDPRTVIPLARRLEEFSHFGAIGPISDPESLNLKEIMSNRDRIDATSFFNVRLDHVCHSVMALLFRWIPQVRFEEGPFPLMAWLIREATKYGPEVLEYPEQRDTREALQRLAKDIRDFGVRLILENQQMTKLYSPIGSQVAVEFVLGQTMKDLRPLQGVVPTKTLRKLRHSNPGQGLICGGRGWDSSVIYALTRHRHKEANEDILLLLSLREYQRKYKIGFHSYLPGTGITRQEREALERERALQPLVLFVMKNGFGEFRARGFRETVSMPDGTVYRLLKEYVDEWHVLVRKERGIYDIPEKCKIELQSLVENRIENR